MRIGRKTRTGLGLSLGILAGVAMILLPGILTVTHSPFLTTHGFANGNNHPGNSTATTSPHTSQNNSTGTTTTSPTTLGVTTALNSTITPSVAISNQTKSTKAPPGSIPSEMPLAAGASAITVSALVLLVSTIVIPALALSFLARTLSTRQANKNLEEHSAI